MTKVNLDWTEACVAYVEPVDESEWHPSNHHILHEVPEELVTRYVLALAEVTNARNAVYDAVGKKLFVRNRFI